MAHAQLIELCEQDHWPSLLRLALDTGYDAAARDEQGQLIWHPLSRLLSAAGPSWQGQGWLWKSHQRPVWLTAWWRPGEEAPLVVISDERAGRHSSRSLSRAHAGGSAAPGEFEPSLWAPRHPYARPRASGAAAARVVPGHLVGGPRRRRLYPSQPATPL